MKNPKQERTIVLIKPDGVKRGLIGETIVRIEKRGLKIIALKMVWPTREHIHGHYPENEEWFSTVGSRTHGFFKERAIDIKDHFGTEEHIKIGKKIKEWLGDYLISGPIVAMVISGMHAISVVRKIVGHTYPSEALPGTIRGDFSVDTPVVANVESRVVKNIVHASGNPDEATHEVEHWFAPEEIFDYKRAEEDTMF